MTTLEKPRTDGEFATELEAWNAFDAIIASVPNAFRMYREVEGEYIQPRPDTECKSARIDRILIPLKTVVDAGWRQGIIGVEGKKSGHKIGRLVSQALDYTRCVFELESPPGMLVMPTWVFIYPLENPSGDMESIMANNRIGHASIWKTRLSFGCGAMWGIRIEDGKVSAKELPMGRKRGSR